MSILSSVSSSATAKREEHLAKHQMKQKSQDTTGVFIKEKKISKKNPTRGSLLAQPGGYIQS
jgi:hypothetical protein